MTKYLTIAFALSLDGCATYPYLPLESPQIVYRVVYRPCPVQPEFVTPTQPAVELTEPLYIPQPRQRQAEQIVQSREAKKKPQPTIPVTPPRSPIRPASELIRRRK